jgi:alkylation response protein AidB-like acyl-CoA dehydrogenase
VGDLVRGPRRGGPGGVGGLGGSSTLYATIAKQMGLSEDPGVRQDLARLHTLTEIARYTNLRQKALRETGGDIPGIGNIAKLSMSIILRLSRDLGMRLLGPRGMLHSYNGSGELADLPSGPLGAMVTEMVLFAQGPQIYGGTDQIQRNIIGERVLGLPKEPNNDRVTPFKDLPRN